MKVPGWVSYHTCAHETRSQKMATDFLNTSCSKLIGAGTAVLEEVGNYKLLLQRALAAEKRFRPRKEYEVRLGNLFNPHLYLLVCGNTDKMMWLHTHTLNSSPIWINIHASYDLCKLNTQSTFYLHRNSYHFTIPQHGYTGVWGASWNEN